MLNQQGGDYSPYVARAVAEQEHFARQRVESARIEALRLVIENRLAPSDPAEIIAAAGKIAAFITYG